MVDKYAHPLVIIYNEKVKTKPTFSAFFFRPKCHTMYTPPPAPSLTMSLRRRKSAIPWGATGRISAPTPSLTEHGGLFVARTSGPVGCANRIQKVLMS